MWSRRQFSVAIALSLLSVTGPQACRSANPYDVDQAQPDMAVLVVKNENLNDMDIYALSSGLPTRVGSITGLSTARFALSPSLYGASDFRLIATPLGGNGRASSGPLTVRSGSTIDFTIGSRLAQSTASVR